MATTSGFNAAPGLSGLGATISPAKLLSFTPLDTRIQKHLSRVYTTLCAAVLVLSVGCWAGMQFPLPPMLGGLASFGCTLALAMTPATPANLNKRYTLLAASAFLTGQMLSSLVALAHFISPSIVLTAALSTVTIFACFSLSALLTPRRSFLFLGGFLASALGVMLVLSLSRLFFRGPVMYEAELYMGLLVFAGYVLFDTQVVVERAASGDFDHVNHAMLLFSDLVSIFIRIVLILIRNAEKKEEENNRNKKRR